MKTKLFLILLILALSPVPCAFSQVPQGFNYQAIVRNTSGLVIQNQPVKILVSIQTLSGTVFWNEEHSLTTTQFGLASFIIGDGPNISGIITNFSKIDWNAQTLYLRTQVQYPVPSSYSDMGTTQIWSVPYSLMAKDVEGPVGKLDIKPMETNNDSALFEVINKDGKTVFAVYNEGVRVHVSDDTKGKKGGFAVGSFGSDKAESQPYMMVTADSIRMYLDSNPLTKAKKGGFAVGGYDMSKGLVQNYLDVSEDSVRIFIDNNPLTKGKKGGFAVGGYDMAKGTIISYFDVATDTLGKINPSQNRLLWYPQKNAFLTGKVLVEKPDSVGLNSFATGYESKAIGNWSQALGYQARARGNYSTSIGDSSISKGNSSFAFGKGAKALNNDSYALGTYAKATGPKSFALGSVGVDSTGNPTEPTIASGESAFAIGLGSIAQGYGSFAVGLSNRSTGLYSMSLGYQTISEGWYSTAMGWGTRAGGIFSTAMGAGSTTDFFSVGATAAGIWTRAANYASTAFGDHSNASGHTSFATGFSTVASGHLSATFGASTTATGSGSIAMGLGTTAQAYTSLVLGRYNVISGTPGAWYSWEPVFVIGNGTSSDIADRSNAMTVYKSGVADFGGYLNLNRNSTGGAVYINSNETIWHNGTYFSWGFGGDYNVFNSPVSIGTTDSPGTDALLVVGTTWSTGGWSSSDIRWKNNISDLGNVLDKIMLLNGVSYTWRREEFPENNFDSDKHLGLIAQDVEKIFPDLVKTNQNGFKAIAYDKLSVILLEGIKEQQSEIESQNHENQQLKSELQALQEKMDRIEALLVQGTIE